jgi:DNA-binding GntR family transcriptional regulator
LRAAERAKTEEYRRYDSRLHLAIAEAAGAPSLMQAIADARTRVNSLLDRIPLLTTNLQHSNSQHRMIIDAILGGEVDRARNAMIEHLQGSAALLRGFLG